jgi:DNA replication protein DnaC
MIQNELNSRLVGYLKELHLPTVRACYEEVAQQAQQESLAYEHYLLEVIEQECQVRQQRRIERLLHESHLPVEKSITHLELERLPRKVVNQVQTLLTGTFLSRRENVLVFGNPGSGKTHLVSALGQEMIQQGHRVFFSHCSLLVQELLRAKQELKLVRTLKKLARYDALILDDIGYVQQSREEMEVLFTLLAERYERGSVMITSNLPFSQWEIIFKDPMTTAAAIDRLVHHCIIIELNVASYRMEQAQKAQEEKAANSSCR